MTKTPSVTAFDDAPSCVDDSDSYVEASITASDKTTSAAEDHWKQRCTSLEGNLYAQTSIFQDLLAEFQAENKKLSTKVEQLTTSLGVENKVLPEKVDKLVQGKVLLPIQAEDEFQETKHHHDISSHSVLEKAIWKGNSRMLVIGVPAIILFFFLCYTNGGYPSKLSEEERGLATTMQEITASLDLSREENKKHMEKVDILVQSHESLSIAQLEPGIKMVMASLDALRKENGKLIEKFDALVQENKRLSNKAETEIEQLSEEKQKVVTNLNISSEENKKLTEKVNALVQEKTLISSLAKTRIERVSMLAKAEFEELSEEKHRLATKAQQTKASLNVSREENKKLVEKVDALVHEKKLLSSQAKVEFEELSEEKHELATKVQQTMASLEALREENKKLMKRVGALVQEKELCSNQQESDVKKLSEEKCRHAVGFVVVAIVVVCLSYLSWFIILWLYRSGFVHFLIFLVVVGAIVDVQESTSTNSSN